MGPLNQDIPNGLQWLGLFATFGGAGLALWAALSAKGARRLAGEAKIAAIRLGRVLELSDLIADMQELQAMLARKDFESIAAKASHLRGRVVRFKTEAYNLLREQEAADLDAVRNHLESIGIAALGKASEASRTRNIQNALGDANEALNKIFAIHYVGAQGE